MDRLVGTLVEFVAGTIGEIGGPQQTDYSAIGRAANLGARICGVAEGGQVLIYKSAKADKAITFTDDGAGYWSTVGPYTTHGDIQPGADPIFRLPGCQVGLGHHA